VLRKCRKAISCGVARSNFASNNANVTET
jgi:hypothetical protein